MRYAEGEPIIITAAPNQASLAGVVGGECDPDEYPVGGGFTTSPHTASLRVHLSASYPSELTSEPNFTTPTAWTQRLQIEGTSPEGINITPYTVCAK